MNCLWADWACVESTGAPKKRARKQKAKQEDSYDLYYPFSEDEIPFAKETKGSKKKPKKKAKAEDSESKGSYKLRKDVIYKRILRGCRKYYLQEFTTFTRRAHSEASNMVKT